MKGTPEAAAIGCAAFGKSPLEKAQAEALERQQMMDRVLDNQPEERSTVDEKLAEINAHLGLEGEAALPVHLASP